MLPGVGISVRTYFLVVPTVLDFFLLVKLFKLFELLCFESGCHQQQERGHCATKLSLHRVLRSMSGGARKRGRLLSDDTDDSSADDGDVPVAAQSHVAATSDAASRPIAASDSQLPIVAPAEGVQSLVESSSTAPLTATSTASVSQESVVVDLTEDNESLAGDLEIPMFRVYTKVVGLNFYRGRVNTGEMVFLVREPSNVYDRNAIRVDDLTRQQVGHVAAKDGTAGTLAPIADGRVRGGVGGTLEAVIVDTPRSTFAVAMVTISGLPEHKQQLAAHMTRAGMEFMDLESGECTPNFAPPETKGRTGKAAKARPSATYTRLSEEEVHSALHRLWDQTDADVAGLDLSLASASCASLARCLLSELYPHQRQGVAWMLQQETGDEQLPPFFSVESVAGQTVYRHALTCHDYPARPARCLGGLLLDDMGLGKTLQIAALVLCNPPAGKEYFPTGEGGEMDAAHAPTLVVCPVSVISSWLDQLQSHLREGTFKVLVYHGSNRVRTAKQVCEHDVVITTYETLSADCRDSTTAPSTSKSPAHKKRAENGPLFGVDWHRVVFDEAHVLRNMRSSKYKACRSLSVKCVWCLTGTPIANSVSDIEALIQLIRLEPFTATPTLFNSVIAKPVKIGQSTAIAQLRTLVKRVSLRRSKKDLKELQLAEKVEINVSVKFSEKELKAYQSIKAATADYMAFLEQSGTGNLLRNSSVVLALITRLRQCCLDVRLIPALALVKLLDFCPGSSSAAAVARLTQEQQEELLQKFTLAFAQASSGGSNDSADEALEESILECCICMEAVRENGVMLRVCQHLFCKVCMDRLFAHDENIDCPLCRRRTMKSTLCSHLAIASVFTSVFV